MLLWSKLHPAGGIAPPLVHPTIAARFDGGVALFGYVEGLELVAARMWADDGNAYADLQVFTTDACDALAAALETGSGWIVACSSKNGTRAQLLREDLTARVGAQPGAIVGALGSSRIGSDCVRQGVEGWNLVQHARSPWVETVYFAFATTTRRSLSKARRARRCRKRYSTDAEQLHLEHQRWHWVESPAETPALRTPCRAGW